MGQENQRWQRILSSILRQLRDKYPKTQGLEKKGGAQKIYAHQQKRAESSFPTLFSV